MLRLPVMTHYDDQVEYEGRPFVLSAQYGRGMFDPCEHGLNLHPHSIHCWRGWLARYRVVANQLYLNHLVVSLSGTDEQSARTGQGPRFLGRTPQRDLCAFYDRVTGQRFVDWDEWYYPDLCHPIPFSGELMLQSWQGMSLAEQLQLCFEEGNLRRVKRF